jgi:general secretion pathway protein F
VIARFRYRAATPRGEVVEGVLEARSREELLDQLRNRELHAVSVEELPAAPARSARRFGRPASVAHWSRSFATLLGAGTPVERALRISAEQASDGGLAEVLDAVRRAVSEGDDLSTALARHPRWFPSVVSAMARAGEATGALGEVFEHVADYLEEDAELRSQVRSALVYPALMAAVAAVGVTVLLLFVVPRFSVILEDLGGDLPLSTRILIFSGTFLGRWWWLLLGLGAATALAARAWLRVPGNRQAVHRRRLTWPVVGDLEQKLVTARYARILGLLLGNGLPLLPSLRIGREAVENLAIGEGLDRGMAAVAEGQSFASSVRGVLPPLAVELLAVGEESGRLDALCQRVAASYDKEVRRTMKVAVSLLEPAMIIVFGGLVGLVALAMLQAIYSVNVSLG